MLLHKEATALSLDCDDFRRAGALIAGSCTGFPGLSAQPYIQSSTDFGNDHDGAVQTA